MVPAALALAVALPAPAPADEQGPLPWRVGGITGFTADAVAFPDSAGQRLEVYLRLRPSTIATLAAGQSHFDELRLEIRLRPGRKGAEQRATQTIAFAPDDTLPGFGKVLVFPFRVAPGPHRLEIRAESRRRLLPDVGHGRVETGSTWGMIDIPAPQAGRHISDIEFVWAEGDSGTARAFRRGGDRLLPNAERLYGLLATTLRAAFVAHAPAPAGRIWHWVARLEDAAGTAVAVRESTGAAGPWLEGRVEFDVSTLPAGAYALDVKAWQDGDAGALERRTRFSIGWDPGTWLRDPEESLDEAHFLLQRDEEQRFQQMLAGERERHLAEYWRDRDPSPGTAENEMRTMFRERVEFANQSFGRFGVGKGMFSDMGRVYIRYGAPSEVHRSVVPSQNDELATVIRQYVSTSDRPIGDVEEPAQGSEMRPFELWVYEGEVTQPFDADPSVGTHRRLRKALVFLFIDENWLGDYRLRYSTE